MHDDLKIYYDTEYIENTRIIVNTNTTDFANKMNIILYDNIIICTRKFNGYKRWFKVLENYFVHILYVIRKISSSFTSQI